MPSHSSRAVANSLLDKARSDGNPLTPMQIIKLVYLCHGWMLGLHGRPLIWEPVEAWQFGPVIRDLYETVRHYKSEPIPDLLPPHQAAKLDWQEDDLVRQVYELYGRDSGIALSRLTHADGTPWSRTWERFGQNANISNDLIQDHFAGLANARSA